MKGRESSSKRRKRKRLAERITSETKEWRTEEKTKEEKGQR